MTILPVDCATMPRASSPFAPTVRFFVAVPFTPKVVSSTPCGVNLATIVAKSAVASVVGATTPTAKILPCASKVTPKKRSWPVVESSVTMGVVVAQLPTTQRLLAQSTLPLQVLPAGGRGDREADPRPWQEGTSS